MNELQSLEIKSQSMITTNNARRQERGHPLDNRVPPPLVLVLIGVAMAAVAWLTPGFEIANNVRFFGGGIGIALGALVVVQGARTFWRNKTTINPVDLESASALVTSGVFRYSRNPMYVGFTVMLVGWAVSLAAPWALLGPVAFVLFTKGHAALELTSRAVATAREAGAEIGRKKEKGGILLFSECPT